jgi:hypothetical protein
MMHVLTSEQLDTWDAIDVQGMTCFKAIVFMLLVGRPSFSKIAPMQDMLLTLRQQKMKIHTYKVCETNKSTAKQIK